MDYIGLVIFVVVVILKFASENHKAQQQKEERRQRRSRQPLPPVVLPPARPHEPPVLFPEEAEPVRPAWAPPVDDGADEPPPLPRPLILDPPARPAEPPPVPRRFVVSGPSSPAPVKVPAPLPPPVPAKAAGSGWGYLFDESAADGTGAEEAPEPSLARVQMTGLSRDALGGAGTLKRVWRASRLGNRTDLRRAVLLSELLGRPKGMDLGAGGGYGLSGRANRKMPWA